MEIKPGKIGANVLDRSVKKRIKNVRTAEKDRSIVFSSDPITMRTKHAGKLAVHAAVNDLAAKGGCPEAVRTIILLPGGTEEASLREIVDEISKTAEELHVRIEGGHTEVTSAVNRVIVTASAYGRKNGIRKEEHSGMRRPVRGKEVAGHDIVVTKWIGLEGTYLLAEECTGELLRRFPVPMVERTRSFGELLDIVPESAAAMMSGADYMTDLSEGGIFAALWKLSGELGTGLDVNLKLIPVRQETIEYCNYFDINPYQIESAGSLLVVTANGEQLVEQLREQEIYAAVIGKTTDGNDKIIRNEEEIRYLDLPQPDSLLKILGD